MTAVTDDVYELKKLYKRYKNSVKFTSEKLDESEQKKSEMKTKTQSIQTLKTTSANLSPKKSCKMKDWNDRFVDLQSRSKTDNLNFHGITETDNENCEDKSKECIEEQFDIRHRRILPSS